MHHMNNEISVAFGMCPFHADAFREESQRFIMSRSFSLRLQWGCFGIKPGRHDQRQTSNEGFLSRDSGMWLACNSLGGPTFVCTYFSVVTSLCLWGHGATIARLTAQPAPCGRMFGCWPGPWHVA